jgi:hypothetical protein
MDIVNIFEKPYQENAGQIHITKIAGVQFENVKNIQIGLFRKDNIK